MNLLKIFIVIIFIIPTVFGQSQSENIQKMADLLVSAYNNKNYALLEQQFSELVKEKIAHGKLKEWLDNLHESSGKITLLGKPAFFDEVAIYPIDFERGKMELIIALDERGKIRGLEINGKKTTISRNKTNMILPFKGEWLIKWGGDTPEQNYHQSISIVRFAFDFLALW